jgi:sortase A
VLVLGGLYVLLLTVAPRLQLPFFSLPVNYVANVLKSSTPQDDRLYIPKLNVDVAIVTGNNISVLDKGAWHRNPQNGDPQKGGNFVLSAHRFSMGFTPAGTRAKSPFFNIDKLQTGDLIYVDFGKVRYKYVVSRLYSVPRTAVQIEGPSATAKMTLYSCDWRGELAGRIVVEALPQGPVT